MRIIIAHNAVTDADAPDERDVLVQAAAVQAALAELGHETGLLPCTLNLADVQQRLVEWQPDLAFNLVESLGGWGRLIHLVPSLLDTMGIPYTGSCAEAIRVTSHKVFAKERLAAMQLPTPSWVGPVPTDLPGLPPAGPAGVDPSSRWIVKSLWEHASIGMDEASTVLCEQMEAVSGVLRDRARHFGGACFAERFIDGREFNLSLLTGPRGPEVLPAVEILFEGYPPETLRIVGYRAKWDESSYEFHHTPRRFEFPPEDSALLNRLQDLAAQCWRAFGLNGYARVDFRVDAGGQPWILEINANPCLSPDAGFAAALEAAGVSYTAAIDRILADARRERLPQAPDGAQPDPAVPCARPPRPDRLPHFRCEARSDDPIHVRRLADATGFFTAVEAAVAEELVRERLAKGEESGYSFIFVEFDRELAGYACFGPVPLTASSYDLYWIVVAPQYQGQGLGRILLQETERLVRQAGGTRLYADTSGRAQYASTRAFYAQTGFREEARLEDFYAPGDAKVIYSKSL
jgi:D-alanine-D-alanine ligase